MWVVSHMTDNSAFLFVTFKKKKKKQIFNNKYKYVIMQLST